jgi:hypothetical protein
VRFLKPLALAAYALLFAELFLRIFAPQAIMPRYVTGTPWGVRGNIPNATYWHQTPEVTVQYRINSQGMRADRDYPVAKPEGTCRVAVYGDSFFVGYELPYPQTYAVRLEQALQAAGIRAEVLNFSVSGFGQAEMLRAHERFGSKFDPDVVLFEWHSTDPDDNVRSGLYRLEHGTVKPTNATYLPSIAVQDQLLKWRVYRLIADNSQLYTFVRERAAILVKQMLLARQKRAEREEEAEEPAEGPQPQPAAEAPQQAQAAGAAPAAPSHRIELSAALLLYAQQELRADHHEFYVVSIPQRRSRVRYDSYARVLPAAARSQLAIIDPTAAFMRASRPDLKLYYERGAGHLTSVAVEILTRETVATLQNSAALSACRTSPAESLNHGSAHIAQKR